MTTFLSSGGMTSWYSFSERVLRFVCGITRAGVKGVRNLDAARWTSKRRAAFAGLELPRKTGGSIWRRGTAICWRWTRRARASLFCLPRHSLAILPPAWLRQASYHCSINGSVAERAVRWRQWRRTTSAPAPGRRHLTRPRSWRSRLSARHYKAAAGIMVC